MELLYQLSYVGIIYVDKEPKLVSSLGYFRVRVTHCDLLFRRFAFALEQIPGNELGWVVTMELLYQLSYNGNRYLSSSLKVQNNI